MPFGVRLDGAERWEVRQIARDVFCAVLFCINKDAATAAGKARMPKIAAIEASLSPKVLVHSHALPLHFLKTTSREQESIFAQIVHEDLLGEGAQSDILAGRKLQSQGVIDTWDRPALFPGSIASLKGK